MLFASQKVPTLAITSTGIFELMDTVVHIKLDTPVLIDAELIREVCLFLHKIMSQENIYLEGGFKPMSLHGEAGSVD